MTKVNTYKIIGNLGGDRESQILSNCIIKSKLKIKIKKKRKMNLKGEKKEELALRNSRFIF